MTSAQIAKFKDDRASGGFSDKTLDFIVTGASAAAVAGISLYSNTADMDKAAHLLWGLGYASMAVAANKVKPYLACLSLPPVWEGFEQASGIGIFDSVDALCTWLGSSIYLCVDNARKAVPFINRSAISDIYKKLVSAKNTAYAGAAYVRNSAATFASLFL